MDTRDVSFAMSTGIAQEGWERSVHNKDRQQAKPTVSLIENHYAVRENASIKLT